MNRDQRQCAFRTALLTAAFAAGAALAGCSLPEIQPAQPDTARYYVLSEPTSPPARTGSTRLAVRTVEVSAYLKNRSLVMRQGTNELKFADDARWAESLDAAIARLVRARVAAATGHPATPEAGLSHDYFVDIRVESCEGIAAGALRLTAEIELIPAGTSGAAQVTRVAFAASPATWDGKDFAQLAHGLSEAVAELADAVLAAVPAKR